MSSSTRQSEALLYRYWLSCCLLVYFMFVTCGAYLIGINRVNSLPSLCALCMWLFTLYGILRDKDSFLSIFMLSIVFPDMVNWFMHCVILISLRTCDRDALLNKLIYDYCPEKVALFDEMKCCFKAVLVLLCLFILFGMHVITIYLIYDEKRNGEEVITEEDGCCQKCKTKE